MKLTQAISGFLATPKKTAKGQPRPGRLTCHDVQWTGTGAEALATFTLTADELFEAAQSRILWTDQEVQRGIRPDVSPTPARELALCDGYPDSQLYIFDAEKADDIAEKLIRGDRVFLSPLIWNLRPDHFEAYWDAKKSCITLYDGKIYLPDSHHRQQAIIKAVRETKGSAGSHQLQSKQFKIELYFLTKQDEGNYFFDKNQRTKPTAKSKAYDLTTQDELSLLAKQVIIKSRYLRENVNRVTDRLTARNPQVITLSTLREMMRAFAPSDVLDESELDGLSTVAAQFYDTLAGVRSELGPLNLAERRACRGHLLVDSAVMMHGYAALARQFNDSIAELGLRRAKTQWESLLMRLAPTVVYTHGRWRGDLFERSNPLWTRVGVMKPGKESGRHTVLNTGAARSQCGQVLSFILRHEPHCTDLARYAGE